MAISSLNLHFFTESYIIFEIINPRMQTVTTSNYSINAYQATVLLKATSINFLAFPAKLQQDCPTLLSIIRDNQLLIGTHHLKHARNGRATEH